jgi:hypothetical protein
MVNVNVLFSKVSAGKCCKDGGVGGLVGVRAIKVNLTGKAGASYYTGATFSNPDNGA